MSWLLSARLKRSGPTARVANPEPGAGDPAVRRRAFACVARLAMALAAVRLDPPAGVRDADPRAGRFGRVGDHRVAEWRALAAEGRGLRSDLVGCSPGAGHDAYDRSAFSLD